MSRSAGSSSCRDQGRCKMKSTHESGKRKQAIARATVVQGSGVVRVNRRLLEHYRPEMYQMKSGEPLLLAGDLAQKVDIDVLVIGGGFNSQAEAARLAIAKSLVGFTKGSKLRETFLSYDR